MEDVGLGLGELGDLFSDPVEALLSVDVEDDEVVGELAQGAAVVVPDALRDADHVGEGGVKAVYEFRGKVGDENEVPLQG